MKRVIAFALSLLMVLSVVIIPASADPASADPTSADPSVDSVTENPTSADSTSADSISADPEKSDNITPKPSNIGSENNLPKPDTKGSTNDLPKPTEQTNVIPKAAATNAATIVAQGTCGANLTWKLDSDGILTISGTGEMDSYASVNKLPWYANTSSIKKVVIGYGVTSIGNYAFYRCTALTDVTIPNGIKKIGKYAFNGCKCTSITVPDSVESISDSAFARCSSLESITLPFVGHSRKKPNETYQYPFGSIFGEDYSSNAIETSQHYYGTHTTSTTSKTYYIPSSLKHVTITSGDILHGAFSNCSGLTSITIADGVTSIAEGAFSGCKNLESITLPFVGGSRKTSSDTYQYPFGYIFGTYSFGGGVATTQWFYGSSLSSKISPQYYIPKSLKNVTVTGGELLYGAFGFCTGIENITICSGVTRITEGAFRGCSNLKSVTLPFVGGSIKTSSDTYQYPLGYIFGTNSYTGGVETTQYYYGSSTSSTTSTTYYIPSSLKNVTITGGNMLYGAFYGCNGLESITIPFVGATKNGTSNTHLGYIFGANNFSDNPSYVPSSLKAVVVTGGTRIGDSAFYGCEGLTSVTIPNSVTSIGDDAFYGCTELEEVYISNIATWWGIKFESKTSNPLYYAKKLYANGTPVTKLVIPNGVTSIVNYAFYGCTEFTSVTIPNSVTSIGDCAFSGCTGLTNVTIGNGVTRIGEYAFNGCTGLTSITIPNSVTSIGDCAFYGCTGLTSITIPFIGASKYGTSDTNFGYIFGASSSFNNEYCVPSSLKTVVVTGGTSIGNGAFYGCKDITSITLPDSINSVGYNPFNGCTSLTYNEYDNGLYIGNEVNPYNVFVKAVNTSISYCNIYIGTKCICGSAFKNCTGLTSIVIPNSVTSIGDSAFDGCTGLRSIAIPDGVTSIGSDMFSYCSGLTNIVIPDSVTSIGDRAFWNCTGLTSVTIGNGVTSIGRSAFSGCTGLTNIKIPNSVTSINYNAFENMRLTSITIPFIGQRHKDGYISFGDLFRFPSGGYGAPSTLKTVVVTGVTSLDSQAFDKWKGLVYIVIPNGTTSIGSGAFSGCEGVTSIEIPNSVTSIGSSAFSGCTGLTSIEIPNSVTSIGSSAFSGCTGLTSITVKEGNTKYHSTNNCLIETESKTLVLGCKNSIIPTDGSATIIGSYAFDKCTGLTRITIPNSVISIGYSAFEGCTGLTNIEISNSVTIIGDNAFRGCTGLTSIDIPDSVTSIGNYAFSSCTGLASITIPDSVTSIGNYAFSGCTGLTNITIPDSVTSIGNYAFSGCTGLKSIEISDSETSIGDYAFSGCTGLKSIEISDSVTSIGYSAFSGCTRLTSMTIPFVGATRDGTSNTHFGYIFGAYYSGYNSNYVPSSLKTVVITGGTSIGGGAFSGCTGLTSVSVGNSVTSIGNSAFSGCTGLTSIEIPDSVTSIGNSAFEDCSGLTGIVIPDSVTSIGGFAFSGCSKLESITLPFIGGSKKTSSDTYQYPFGYIFGTSSYTGGVARTQYYYGSSTISMTSTTFYIPSSLKNVTITGGDILHGAFNNCSGLTSIVIPDSVTSIGYGAFQGCTGLTSITIPDSVTSIGNYAFDGCTGLTSIEIPNSVMSIGWSAFSGCSKLESITLPFVGGSKRTSSDTYQYPLGYIFGTSSYTGGVATTQYYYDSSTSSTTSTTFYIPSSLKNVTITGGDILYGAFFNCTGLTSITIGKGVTSINDSAFTVCTNLTTIIGYTHAEDFESIAQNFAESNGYEFKCLDIAYKGCQVSNGIKNGENFKIRFVNGIESLDYRKVGFDISVASFGKNWTDESNTVYQSLLGTTEDGTPITAVTAEEANCEYLTAVVIKNIPGATEITFEVKPFVVNQLGEKVYGETWLVNISAEGAVTNAKQ